MKMCMRVCVLACLAMHAMAGSPVERAKLRALGQGVVPAGSIGAAELADEDFGAFTVSGGVASLDTADDVTAVAGAATSVESWGESHKCVITITNAQVALADGDDGEGVKVADFPEGVWLIEGVVADLVVTNSGNFNASDDDHYYVSLGTVEATDADNDLTGTEANLLAKQPLDTAAGATTSADVETFLSAPVIIDGSSTALDVWCNASVEATDNSDANTIDFTGTVTIWGRKLGDY